MLAQQNLEVEKEYNQDLQTQLTV